MKDGLYCRVSFACECDTKCKVYEEAVILRIFYYVTVVTRCSTKILLNDEGQSSESDFETDSDGSVTEMFRTESRTTSLALCCSLTLEICVVFVYKM